MEIRNQKFCIESNELAVLTLVSIANIESGVESLKVFPGAKYQKLFARGQLHICILKLNV